MNFFDPREVGRFPSIAEAMDGVATLRDAGISATFQEDPQGPPEPGVPCPAAVLVEDAADREEALGVLSQQVAGARFLASRRHQWLEVAVVLLAAWALRTFEGVAVYVWPDPEGPLESIPFTVYGELWILMSMLPLVALVLYLLRRDPRPARDFGLGRPRFLMDAFGGLVLVVAMAVVSGLSGETFAWLFPSEAPPVILESPSTAMGYLVSAVATLVAVVGEELAFRAYLIPRLEELLGRTWIAITVAAIFFGTAHAYQGLSGVFATFWFGILFGVCFTLAGRLWPVIVGHLVWNLIVLW